MKMRFFKLPLLFLCFLLVFATQANALSIDPTTNNYTPSSGLESSGLDMYNDIANGYDANNPNNTDAILKYIAWKGYALNELYKSDVDGGEETGPLAGSYKTTYSPSADPSGAIIEYTGGSYVGDPAYLLVKDGGNAPYWYLFDLTLLGWDGMQTLELSGFWPGQDQGSISHVALYGQPVPEPATMLLFGVGLCGLAFVGRKKLIKQG